MCPNNPKELRKQIISKITADGDPLSGATFKRSVDVLNSVIEDLIDSIDKSSKSNNQLSWVVAVATIFLVAVGIADLCFRFLNVGAKCP